MICQICKKEFTCLSSHIFRHAGYTKEKYYLEFLGKEHLCPVCGKKTRFISLTRGYQKHCSCKCAKSNPEEKEKFKKTCLEKYGVSNPGAIPEVCEKRKETMFSKYGGWAAQNKEIKEKQEKTLIMNYGVDNPRKSEEIKKLMKLKSLEKYGTEFPSQSDIAKVKQKDSIRKKFFELMLSSNRLNGVCIPNFTIDDYKTVKDKYSWTCVKCGEVFESNLNNGNLPRCLTCNPPYPKSFTSKLEKEISFFCKQYYPNLLENDRKLLNGQEVDIYIPEIKLAIEFNGVYWHSELNGKSSKYHLEKTENCLSKGVQLIHIFEDEWVYGKDIVKSVLLSKMKKISQKIYARNCEIKDITRDMARKFLHENHLQGDIMFGKSLGLFFCNELVSMICVGEPRYDKKYDVELLRFCNKKNLVVVGGLTKLLSRISGKIISYCDIRYSNGSGYKSSGFIRIRQTQPSYWYLDNYMKRYNRNQFQKHLLECKLDIFDPNLTEWQNMQLNGYDRIWDCGQIVFERKEPK